MTKRFCALIAAFAVIAGAASAADLKPMPYKAPPPAPVAGSWTGFYAGADVGFRSAVVDPSVASAVVTGPGIAGSFDPLSICATALVPCPAASPLNNTAFRGGFYGGYNYQIGPRWLVGVEGDVGFADASRTASGQIYPGGAFAFSPVPNIAMPTTAPGPPPTCAPARPPGRAASPGRASSPDRDRRSTSPPASGCRRTPRCSASATSSDRARATPARVANADPVQAAIPAAPVTSRWRAVTEI